MENGQANCIALVVFSLCVGMKGMIVKDDRDQFDASDGVLTNDIRFSTASLLGNNEIRNARLKRSLLHRQTV